MPRPIVRGHVHTTPALPERQRVVKSDPAARISLRKRSTRYIDALKGLDAAGASLAVDIQTLHHEIDLEFRPVIDAVPIGFVSRCYLGHPYEVHELDMFGGIVEHFETYRRMPNHLERARALATHPSYALIEVYADSLVCVRLDGSVAQIQED